MRLVELISWVLCLARYAYPKLYRAWIICLMPVLGPNMARNAGGIVDSIQKNKMTRDESLRLRLYAKGPNMPKVMLHKRLG